ncbi:MAG: N-acetyltransferase [Proteobacteria bacterium]|nr:N-acetyltransferase [Pseudomonadota bacterium]
MKVIKDTLTDKLKKTIYDGFKQHAIASTGASEIEKPIAFYFQDSQGQVISAIVAQTFWGNLHIKYVWTHEEHRSKGYASKLMNEIFNFAKEKRHAFAFIETMNFQAPEFYKKFGFQIELIREGYSRGTSFYYMRKDFDNR